MRYLQRIRVWQYRNLNAIHRASRQLDQKKLDDWVTKQLRDLLYTESEFDVVDERSQYPRELPWVNPFTWVSLFKPLDDSSLLLKNVSVVTVEPSESSTPTGLEKTQPTSISRSC